MGGGRRGKRTRKWRKTLHIIILWKHFLQPLEIRSAIWTAMANIKRLKSQTTPLRLINRASPPPLPPQKPPPHPPHPPTVRPCSRFQVTVITAPPFASDSRGNLLFDFKTQQRIKAWPAASTGTKGRVVEVLSMQSGLKAAATGK